MLETTTNVAVAVENDEAPAFASESGRWGAEWGLKSKDGPVEAESVVFPKH
jgi:hypothetical protein